MANRHHYQKGCVFQRGRKRKVWVGRWRERVLEEGKSIEVQRSKVLGQVSHMGKKEAQWELERILDEVNHSPYRVRSSLTFSDFAARQWEAYQKQTLKPSTQAAHRSNLKSHLLPAFGNSQLEDISSAQVFDLLEQNRQDGLSPKTLLNLYLLLQKMLRLAVDLQLLSTSPMSRVPKPRTERVEKPTLTPAQVRSLIEAVPEKLQALFVVLYLTGLRIGEALALKWKDVDFADSKLYVRRSLWRRREQTPKSRRSVRAKHVLPTMAAALVRHRELSFYTQAEDYIFTTQAGKPLDPDDLRKRTLYPAMDKVGIKHTHPRAYGFHLFRHSAGSEMHKRTNDLKQTQRFLGHSGVAVTADVYVHLQADTEVEAMKKLEEAVFPDKSFPTVPKSGERPLSGRIN